MIEYKTIPGVASLRLFYQQLVPADPIGWVIIVHGWGEHSGRYEHVTKHLNAGGFGVVLYDHRGHGRSEGLRTYVNRFSDYTDDLATVHQRVVQLAGPKPVFLLAQSMGCLVACQFCLIHQPALHGVILSAAALKVSRDFSPFLQKISGVISAIVPKLATLKLDNTKLSRDPAVLAAVLKDPLHYKGGILARTGAEVLKMTKWVEAHTSDFKLPVLLLHGGADEIAIPEGSVAFHAACGSSDRTCKVYPGAYHEVMNEINKEEVLSDILSWLEVRIPR